MKKTIALTLALLVLLTAVFGCQESGKQDGSTEAPTRTENNSTEPTEEESTAAQYGKYLDENGRIKGFKALEIANQEMIDRIEISEADLAFTDEEFLMELKSMLASNFLTEDKDRAVTYGDCIVMDYSGKLDGVAFDGGTATNQALVAGSNDFVDNFLTKIIGHKPGETFDIDIRFPDNYGNELAGKDTVFTVTIQYIANPELTDEFVAANAEELSKVLGAEVHTAAEVEAAEREYIREELMKDLIVEKIQELPIENIPQNVLDYVHNLLDLTYMTQYGLDFDSIAAYYGLDAAAVQNYIKESAKLDVVFHAVAEIDGIEATEEDFVTFLNIPADSVEEKVEHFGKPYLKNCVMQEKAMRYLVSHVKVTE